MTWIFAILGTVGGWILKLIFGDRNRKKLEAEIVATKKENIDLRADLAGKKVEAEIVQEADIFDMEWKESDTKGKYELLKKDFKPDSD